MTFLACDIITIFLAKTDTGFTPLMTAVQSGNLEAIKLLVTCNANINAQNSYHGKLLFKRLIFGSNTDCVL